MANKHGYPNLASHERLRQSAEDLIEHGVTSRNKGGSLSLAALHLLYERASQPESAADALKLLHELQTYQVELDLLYEQLQANEQEISEELAHYRSLYEKAPAAYLIVATGGEVIEGNEAASVLLGESQQALSGRMLSKMLAPGQEGAARILLNDVMERTSGVQSVASGFLELPDHRRLAVSARSSVAGDSVLIVLTEVTTHAARF